mgnify:CR=1 FL=1
MHRARLLPSGQVDYAWYRPRVRFAEVPKGDLEVKGAFQRMLADIVGIPAEAAGVRLDHRQFIYMPVHELQLPNLSKLFPDVAILPEAVHLEAYAQSSIR